MSCFSVLRQANDQEPILSWKSVPHEQIGRKARCTGKGAKPMTRIFMAYILLQTQSLSHFRSPAFHG